MHHNAEKVIILLLVLLNHWMFVFLVDCTVFPLSKQALFSPSLPSLWVLGVLLAQFTLVTQRPYCPGRPKELCFTTLSLGMETMGMRLSLVKQSFFGLPGQYGRRVTRVNVVQDIT